MPQGGPAKKISFGQGSFEDGAGLMPQGGAGKKIGFGQGSFEDGACPMPQGWPAKNWFRPRVV